MTILIALLVFGVVFAYALACGLLIERTARNLNLRTVGQILRARRIAHTIDWRNGR